MGDLTRQQRRALEAENRRWPDKLRLIPESELSGYVKPPRQKEAWRSRKFLVQVFDEGGGVERLSVNFTSFGKGRWIDGLTWDDLQRLKAECGRGEKCAVEIFPPEADKVDVANMRHLFVLPEPPDFMWASPSQSATDEE